MNQLTNIALPNWVICNEHQTVQQVIENQIKFGFYALNDLLGGHYFSENGDIVNISYKETEFSFDKNNVKIETSGTRNNLVINFINTKFTLP